MTRFSIVNIKINFFILLVINLFYYYKLLHAENITEAVDIAANLRLI